MAACCAILEAAQTAITFNSASFPTCYGIQFTNHDRHIYAFEYIFDRVCREHQIEHRLTKVKHPWTNGQVERMNRTVKDATIKHFHDDDNE